jgi:type III secretion protein F
MALDLNTIGSALGKNTTTQQSNLEDVMKNLDPNKPEDMVKMQMAMQKWQMALSMQSTMIQSLGDAVKGIVQKMG